LFEDREVEHEFDLLQEDEHGNFFHRANGVVVDVLGDLLVEQVEEESPSSFLVLVIDVSLEIESHTSTDDVWHCLVLRSD
jgi:hypothetical protein